MLSATGPGSSTRFTSQSSASSTAMREATANNPLADLIRTEKSYLETLKIIDTQIAARWMKQIVSAAPDFSVALKCVHEILKVNKQFCSNLVRVAGDPRAMRELGDILMQWIDEMEAPYTNYAKAYIPNLDKRQDIVSNTSIQHLLENISANLSAHITLESLFSAPIERISYYKSLYSRLLDSTRPGRADYKILFGINQRIDALLQLANRHVHTRHAIDNFRDNSSSLTKLHGDVRLLKAFLDRVDCSRVVDFFSNMPTGYQLRWSTENTLLLLQDSFIMVSERINASAVRMNFVLTEHELAVCREDGSTLWLMYPPFAVRDISVKAVSINRELLGEYILQLSICESRQLVVRASTKLQRNIWLGLSEKAPSAIAAKPKALTHVVNLRMKQLQEAQRDTATVSTASSVVTESKTKSGKERREAVRDTIMEFYDRRFSLNDDEEEVPSLPSSKEKDHAGDDVDEDDQTLDNLIPRSVKVRSRLPEPQQVSPLEAPAPLPNQPSLAGEDKTLKEVQQKMDSAIVQMTYIEPTTAHKMTITTEQDEEPDTPRVIPRAKDLTKNTATTTETVPRTISRKDVNAKEETKPGMLQSVRAALATSVATSIDSSPKLYTSIVSSSSTSQTDSSARSYDNSSQKPNISPTSPLPRTTSASQHNAPPIGDPKYRPPNPQQRHPPPQETGRPPREDSQLGRQQQQQPQAATPVQQQPYPTRSTSTPFDAVRGSYATDELSSPPLSPGAYANATRKILYTHGECEVFHWKDNTWYSAESRCSLQVRQTNANRACVSIQLLNSGQLYLNAWILPNTKIQQLGESDVSLSVYLGFQQENYLIHFQHRQEALALTNVLMAVHQESILIWGPLRQNSLSSASAAMTTPQSTPASNPFAVTAADVTAVTGGFTGVTLSDPEEKPSREEGPQTLKPLLQCRCKLFAQQEHSQWNNIGSVNLHISQQMPSGKMHVQMDNGKTMLVSATIQSYNVERIQAKRLSFLLQDAKARTSMVYMLHFKDESTASKVFDYVKVKNAQNGW